MVDLFIFSLLSKATTLERAHGPSWLAYGHTFGMNTDHDQAMAAYFTASQIMRGYVMLFSVCVMLCLRLCYGYVNVHNKGSTT